MRRSEKRKSEKKLFNVQMSKMWTLTNLTNLTNTTHLANELTN